MKPKLFLHLFLIPILFLFCSQSKNRLEKSSAGHGESANIDQFCKQLEEVSIPHSLDQTRTNLSSVNYIFHSCAQAELHLDIFHSLAELRKYIRYELNVCPEYFKDISGKDYIVEEMISRVRKEVNFESMNFIILNANFGGPPFNSIHCEYKNSKINISIKSHQNQNGISGLALRPVWKLFKVKKSIEVKH